MGKIIILTVLISVIIFGAVKADARTRCPEWEQAPIIIEGMNKETGIKEVVPGGSFKIEARFSRDQNCGSNFTWKASDFNNNNIPSKDIVIGDLDGKITYVNISAAAIPGSRFTLRGIIYFPNDKHGKTDERGVAIHIKDKPRAPEPDLKIQNEPKSFEPLKVDWSLSKAFGGNNFVRRCSLNLFNETGVFIYKGEASADFGKPKRLISLTPEQPEIYRIEAECEDSLGVRGTLTEYIQVNMSDSKRNKPKLIVDGIIPCSLDCVIDLSKIKKFDRNIKIEINDMTTGEIRVINYTCGNERCSVKFKNPGTYQLQLLAQFYWYNGHEFIYTDKSETKITVIVSQKAGVAPAVSPAPARTAAAAVQPTLAITRKPEQHLPVTTPPPESFDRPKAPGAGIFTAIVVIIIAFRLKKI